MILRPVFCFKDTKIAGLLKFNSLKQKKLIFNFVVNGNWKKLTDSLKRAKILADNRKSYHTIETLSYNYSISRELRSNEVLNWSSDQSIVTFMPNRTFIFDPETSCDGCDDKNDSFVTVNIPLLVSQLTRTRPNVPITQTCRKSLASLSSYFRFQPINCP